MNAWDKVMLARHVQRPTSQYYIENCLQGFLELHGDRSYGDDASIIGGIATIGGHAVTVIGQEKGGAQLENRIARNFGSPHPEGYRKALRLMRQAEKFHRPILCLIDTQGAYSGVGAEERGQGEAIAQNLMQMMHLKTPIIAVVLGEGGSGGALAMAVADEVWMLENAVYSILSPEGFASILWKDAKRAQEAAEVMKLTAQDLMELRVIDRILPEPEGGAHENPQDMAVTLKNALEETLGQLRAMPLDTLLAKRYEKFRSMGAVLG